MVTEGSPILGNSLILTVKWEFQGQINPQEHASGEWLSRPALNAQQSQAASLQNSTRKGHDVVTSQLNASYSQVLSLHLNFVFVFFGSLSSSMVKWTKVLMIPSDKKGAHFPWGTMTGGCHDTFGLVSREFDDLSIDFKRLRGKWNSHQYIKSHQPNIIYQLDHHLEC